MTDQLVTPAEAAEFLGSGASATDPTLVRLTSAVCQSVIGSCGREFLYAERVEYVRGYGHDYVFLREAPIAALVEVRIDSRALFGDDTIVDLSQFYWSEGSDDGRLWWRDGIFREFDRIAKVTYRAGYYPTSDTNPLHLPKLPDDLRTVILDEIAARAQRGTSEEFKSETIGGYTYTRFDGQINPSNRRWLARYRR